jgi:serine/threonine protein phosphatase PrpC
MPEAARAVGLPGFVAAGATDRGRIRDGNEDRLHVDAERGIFVVADGVGGHAAGEVAATIAVDVIVRRLQRPLWSPEQRVHEAIALANNEILTEAQSSPMYAGMTCVLTLALLSEQKVTIGHVGDTRLYRLTPEGMAKLTHDHSPIGEREDSGEITEAEAMRHPRRNQVFRDVGSSFHEPGDPDFVEVIDAPFDERTALLLCSDGLSDMVASPAIEQIVRQHAGNPGRVAEALIQAANEAGGRDNVTVIYIEGVGFAHALRRSATVDAASAVAPAVAQMTQSVHGLWQSRAAWLAMGLFAGLAMGIALSWILARDAPSAVTTGRTLLVRAPDAAESPGTFATIAEALRNAQPRDLVQLEPGEYTEAVILPDGVSLGATMPGSATLVGRPGQVGWVAVVASGKLGHRVSGIRVLGRPDAPVSVGFRLAGHGVELDDVSLEGQVDVGIDITGDGDITVRANRADDLEGLPLRIGAGSAPIIRQNHFVLRQGSQMAAAEVAADATIDNITGNLFSGYRAIVKDSPAREAQLAGTNLILRGAGQPVPWRRTP